jgi:integrase
MMSVYKPPNSRYWWMNFTTPAGRRIRASTRCTTRKAAEAFERSRRAAAEEGDAGFVPRAMLGLPITEHIAAFISQQRSVLHLDPMYCYTTEKRLRRVCEETGWSVMADVSAESFDAWRHKASKVWARRKGVTAKKGAKPKTLNQYLDVWREFMDWCVRSNRATGNPIAGLEKARVIDNKRFRRSATLAELQSLLACCDANRKAFYQFLIYTPLRMGTMKQLRWGDLHLDAKPTPYLLIRPETFKGRVEEKSPLRPEVVETLRPLRQGVKDDAPLFPSLPTIDDLKADLLAAGVPFCDEQGVRRLDFHAFRRTAIFLLKANDVPLEQASKILHHKCVSTTARYYNDDAPDAALTAAVAKMPRIGESL